MSGAFSRPTRSRVQGGFSGNGNFNGYTYNSQNSSGGRFNNNCVFPNNQPNNIDGSFTNNFDIKDNRETKEKSSMSLVVSTVPWERKTKLSWHDKQILGNVSILICWNCDCRAHDKLLVAMTFGGLFAFGDAAIETLENQAKYMHQTNPLEQGVYSFGHGIVAKIKEHPNIVASEEKSADFFYHFLIANIYSIYLSSVADAATTNTARYFGSEDRLTLFCALCDFVEQKIIEKTIGMAIPSSPDQQIPGADEIDTTSVFTNKKSFIAQLFNKGFLILINWEPNWRTTVHPTGDLRQELQTSKGWSSSKGRNAVHPAR